MVGSLTVCHRLDGPGNKTTTGEHLGFHIARLALLSLSILLGLEL